ncbi:hypothetical protein O6H91_14G005200 [Diphasiastrum complanatum]|uniref:Uncharacterized protein n=1 Tax=Diphasiastrum complanatum TaxID=34168 RepID=A0ACC2BM27_DIPCM|nr:hypothetical protein O6H91_14G005200 [Diphasiastrum complanatum]
MMMFGGSFKSMIEQKEREIVKLCEEQIVTLQKQILDKDNELAKLIAKVLLLQEDFKYNLNLIDERDAELKQYDQEMSSLKVSVKEGERQLNEISHSLLEAESKVLEEKVGKDEMTKKYKKKINDLQEQMEELRLEKDVEYQNKLESLEAINADLLQQLIEKQKEYDCKSKEMVKRYGDKKQSQTLQFELELDEVKQKLRVGDIQLKHLERELEAAVTREKLQDELEEELRLRIRDKEKEIQKISLAFQQLQNEMESLKVKAECEASCMSEKLKCIEGDYQIQNVQLKRTWEAAKS